MTTRDPDWLPTPAPNTGPDVLLEALDSGDCEHCDGTGIDQDVMDARGYRIDCEYCGGTGCEQELEPDTTASDELVEDL